MRGIKLFLFFLTFCMLISCESYQPPNKYTFDNYREFSKSYDEVWQKIINWFGKNGIPIKNLDKSSGFIASEHNLNTGTIYYMDCGEGGSQTDGKATINIVVVDKGESTLVTINTFFSCFLSYMGANTGAHRRIDCNSTGRLESEIFEYINK